MYRNDNIHIEDLKLSNHKNVLAVSVDYSKRSKAIALRIQPLERNPGGLTMVALFGGPRSANVALEACGRFNEKRLVAIAEDLKANGKDSEFGDQYEEALSGVLDANGYTLAFRDTLTGEYIDAYKPESLEVGQRVVIQSGRDKRDIYAWVVGLVAPDTRSQHTRYDLIADNEDADLQLFSNMEIDSEYQPIRKSEIMGDSALASPEFIAGLVQAYEHQQAEKTEARRVEAEQKAAASIEAMAKVKAEFPWAQQTGSSYARGSANLKMQLSMAFPGVQFSVKSESYSMGCSIRVKWTDGPTEAQVNEFAKRYQYSYLTEHDMHTDSSSYKDWDKEFRTWMGDAKHVSVHRSLSQLLIDAVTSDLRKIRPEVDLGDRNEASIWLRDVDARGRYTGLEVIDNVYVPQFEPLSSSPAAGANIGPWPPASSGNGSEEITVSENEEKGGVEIKFKAKPDSFTLSSLKTHGFRWSKFQKLWYAKATESRLRFAYALTGTSMETRSLQQQGAFEPDHFDMQVEDNMAAACFA